MMTDKSKNTDSPKRKYRTSEWQGEKFTINMYLRLYEQCKIYDGGAAHDRLKQLQKTRRLRRMGIKELRDKVGNA